MQYYFPFIQLYFILSVSISTIDSVLYSICKLDKTLPASIFYSLGKNCLNAGLATSANLLACVAKLFSSALNYLHYSLLNPDIKLFWDLDKFMNKFLKSQKTAVSRDLFNPLAPKCFPHKFL